MNWQEHRDLPRNGQYLCKFTDIPESGGFEVTFGDGDENFKILLIRQDDAYWCYLNSCPHFALPLNYHPQKFIFSEGMLVCAHHTAFFKVDSGDCVDGPCQGTSLTRLPAYLEGGAIYFGTADA